MATNLPAAVRRSESFPVITLQTVKSALDSLRYGAAEGRAQALTAVTLVDHFLADPALPPTPYLRTYALQNILIALITEEISYHRRVVGLKPPEDGAPLAAALAALAADGQQASPELLGWSWLYHHYVRVELDISPTRFSQTACVDARTLRRYQRHIIGRLTQRLIEQEWQARRQQQRRHLYAQLPAVAPVRLVGRERAWTRLQRLLIGPLPHHVQITGAAGIGKSALVQEVVRQQIDAGHVSQVIWVAQPSSIQQVMAGVQGALPVVLSLREYAELHPVVLALDGIERLGQEAVELERLLDELGRVRVYLTSRDRVPLSDGSAHIALAELERPAAAILIRAAVKAYALLDEGDVPDDEVEAIWARAGGNPGAIRQAVQALCSVPDRGEQRWADAAPE